MSGVGSSPALATCETRQVLLAGVSCGFPGVLPFRPTYRLDIKLNKKKESPGIEISINVQMSGFLHYGAFNVNIDGTFILRQ